MDINFHLPAASFLVQQEMTPVYMAVVPLIFGDYFLEVFNAFVNTLTSFAVQFYLGFCSKSGTLAARLASYQCPCISLSANDSRMSDKTV